MRFMLLLAAAAALSTGAFAQSSDAEHAAHHPSGAAAQPATPKTAAASARKPAAKSTTPTPSQMNVQMKAMEQMHEKMLAAKTPEERQALMADNMKAMRDGMAMMDQMKTGKPGTGMDGMHSDHHEMMSRRMDMMEIMMQMMMDREAASASAAK